MWHWDIEAILRHPAEPSSSLSTSCTRQPCFLRRSFNNLAELTETSMTVLFLSFLQVKNRTKKHCKMRRKRPSETEQHMTSPPPPPPLFSLLQPSLLSPATVLTWVYTAAHNLPPFLPISLTVSPCMHVISQSGHQLFFLGFFYFIFDDSVCKPVPFLRFMSSFTVFIYFAVSSVAKYACLYL